MRKSCNRQIMSMRIQGLAPWVLHNEEVAAAHAEYNCLILSWLAFEVDHRAGCLENQVRHGRVM